MRDNNARPVRVAISQRIVPHYRLPVFAELARRQGFTLTVFYGKGSSSGSGRNADQVDGFHHRCLFTIPVSVGRGGSEKYRPFHPFLWIHLIRGGYSVVIVEPSTNLFNNMITYPVCKLLGKKLIWWEAGPSGGMTRLRRLIEPMIRCMIRTSDAFVTYNSVADQYLWSLGVPLERTFRAQNTLNTNLLEKDIAVYQPEVPQLRRELGLEDAKIALFIGGVERRKRINNLIEATGAVRQRGINAIALIVGDGPYLSELKQSLTREQQTYILAVGRRVKDAALYILASDVVVLPGGGGLAVNHGLVCGKPVIATPEADAITDYIRNGDNGYIVDVDDVPALSQALLRVFADPELYWRLRDGASTSGRELSLSRMVDGIEAAIHYVTRGKASKEAN